MKRFLVIGALVLAADIRTPAQEVVVLGDGRAAADARVPGSAGWGDALGSFFRAGVRTRNVSTPDWTAAALVTNTALAGPSGPAALLLIGLGQGDAEARTPPPVFASNLALLVSAATGRAAQVLLVTPPLLTREQPEDAAGRRRGGEGDGGEGDSP